MFISDLFVPEFMFAHERLYEESLITDEGEAGIHPCCRLVLLDVEVGIPGQSVALSSTVMRGSLIMNGSHLEQSESDIRPAPGS